MPAILPSISIDRSSFLARFFTPYQLAWIFAEDHLHAQNKQAFILAEKSVRIGWTYADAYKNIRKRLNFKNRDYLFATKDYPSALEYMRVCKQFTEMFNTARSIISHGEDYLKVPRDGSQRQSRYGVPASAGTFTEEIKIGYIKFDNGSRIIAFSAHPQAMAVYGGDVGLDEFAKHSNAELLWQTAQGRVTWAYDLALWSSHEGDDTLFNQFAQQARLSSSSSSSNPAPSIAPSSPSSHASRITHHEPLSPITHLSSEALLAKEDHASFSPGSTIQRFNGSTSPWNLYFKVTITDAIELGLLDVINRTRNSKLTADQFLADCRARAGLEQIFQQSYMCNPVPGGASIVDWSAIERCRSDYSIERVHLESAEISHLFGQFDPSTHEKRQSKIESFLLENFSNLLSLAAPKLPSEGGSGSPRPIRLEEGSGASSPSPRGEGRGEGDRSFRKPTIPALRLGFDIAASGSGDLSVIYIDEARADDLWLRALFTCRTEDWDFLKTVLFFFLEKLPRVRAAGDESGLGRQICWEAAQQFSYKFTKVNFSSKKQDLGFALMNQLSVAEKHFPIAHPDIAADFFALRKIHTGTKWLFTEGRNNHNPDSHCDIAWAAALSTYAHIENDSDGARAVVVMETEAAQRLASSNPQKAHEHDLLWSNDPGLWRPFKL